ncbi:Aureobasidin resistance protein Aur1 [Mortierella sp. NVP85]|nr:Aureobasidin resistance protein Aur1 [Mortierella sp. NVP85]
MLTLVSSSFRYRRSLQAAKSALATALQDLKQHTYSTHDLQYVFLFMIFSFCYTVVNKPVWFKLPIVLLSLTSLIPRRTRAFMLPFLAVASWLVLFYSCRFIPSEWRPHIYTSVLPTLDNIIYGGNLSGLLASSTGPWKDLLAWIPYGILHFVMPVVVAIWIALFAPAGTLPVFARTFGYMNLAGVLTQLFFPCAPPWYDTRYGPLRPAVYSMPGDPGGLTRLAFFIVFTFGPRAIPFALSYVFWIWWAAMYLGHHYVVDLVGGGIYAIIAFWIGSTFLPSVLDPLMEISELYQCPEYSLVATKDWDKVQENDNVVASGNSIDGVIVDIISTEADTKAATLTAAIKDKISSEPHSQGWNGWIGYENWMVVLVSMKSGRFLPRNYPRVSTGITQKSPLMDPPIDSGAELRVLAQYSLEGSIGLADTEAVITAGSGAGSSTSTSSPSSSSFPLPSVLWDNANVVVSTTAGMAAEDESIRCARAVQLSVHSSHLVAASATTGSVPEYLELEVTPPSTLATIEAGRDSGLALLTVGTNAAGMFVPSLSGPAGGSGKRFKDD